MTVQEAYALSAERQDNLAYRRKIQRIKNTILGVLAGTGVGVGIGVASNAVAKADETPIDKILNAGRKKNKGVSPVADAALGALAGGVGGYGLTRLRQSFSGQNEAAPTLAFPMPADQY